MHSRDVLSDPTVENGRSLRKDRKRNYKEMLDGNEAFKKSKLDEEIEIRQKFSHMDSQNEAIAQYEIERPRARKKPIVDKVFSEENDLIMDAKENNDGSESEEDEEYTKMDFMDDGDIEMVRNATSKGQGPVTKRNAIDRTADTNADVIQGRDDEADDTVFIDKLPKDEKALKDMIKEVNIHIRELERQFFEEEDSEVENQMKGNFGSQSAAEHN